MPRVNGNYQLPATHNPVVTDTPISSEAFNATMSDLGNEITGSLPIDGSKPMAAVLKLTDGTVSQPSLTFNSEAGLGLFRKSNNTLAVTVAGSEKATINTTTMTINTDVVLSGTKDIEVGGDAVVTGSVTAGSFGGVGTSLTALNASNLGSGTVPTARLSGTYGINISGTAATALAAGNSTYLDAQPGSYYTNSGNQNAGTLPVARLTGTYNIDISGNAATATNATNAASATAATNAAKLYINGAYRDFSWSGQGGTPSYVWGSNDGANFYVWSPGNFSVNYATSAGSATSATSATTASYATYQWSTSHSGTYYVSNAWDGTYWQLTSNHGAGVRVAYADSANAAAYATTAGSATSATTSGNGTSTFYNSGTGYQLFHNGFKIQWGTLTTVGNNQYNVSYPVSFTSYSRAVINGTAIGGNPQDNGPAVASCSTTGFTCYDAHDTSKTSYWVAMGY